MLPSKLGFGQTPISLEAMHQLPHDLRSPLCKPLALLLCLASWLSSGPAFSSDWITWPSTYTHSSDGQRVDQHTEPEPALAVARTDFQRSGMRHYRSTLRAGLSVDNYHVVEQWGQPVVPYEQWRFPYRPYGVPYGQWGPQAPYGIFNGQFNGLYGPTAVPPGGFVPPGQNPGVVSPGVVNPGVNPGIQNPGVVPGYPYPGLQRPGLQPGYGYPGYGYPGYGGGFGQGVPGYPPATNGFPLTPPYTGQPWFNGHYREAPPLLAP